MGDVNELKKKGTKTMANLPGSIKNLNTLLGEQLLDGGGSGGGGSSDFSTAVVIVEGEDEIAAPVIMFEDTPPYLNATTASGEFTVALYKGRAFCPYYGDKKVTVSGNAEVYGSGVIVTGDCTITLS